ncbi:MAG TPA: SH3 domain-containing protein, partial [Actinopolymorphaceae bacterium]
FDRATGTFTEQSNPDLRFRSASIVKLLIVLDYLWDRGPTYDIPAADRTRLDAMLRSSDDSAATYFWQRRGNRAIVSRMVTRLGLTHTEPPPSSQSGYWGYTALTAGDTVRIYRYLLDTAPAPVREYVMGNLHQVTRCGTDGFDQSFGIPSVFEQPYSAKQGWSGFASGGCSNTVASASDEASGAAAGDHGPMAVDLVSEALHTTGTVGANDRSIVSAFTLHPDGTSYGTAYSKINQLVRSLDVPGATARTGSVFGTWGSGVRVRADASTSSTILTQIPPGVEVLVSCQKRGETVTVPPYTNPWWAYLPLYGGYMTNIYVSNPDNQLPGVPEC